ncbi:hypothetical protein [Sinomonas humi]|uniref:Uncharacterized protein n=1 Tax=Sinomonas humi TaxID=1338436 RepID=A0A0B2ALI0_9MICC|nr:hypothetical protein [Sinomonas humi]KHL04196.1 hypothetical protein LK10_06480 [Sinomonas humi]
MKFHGLNDRRRPPVHYEALPASSPGADDAVEGDLLRGRDGYLFKDTDGEEWWVMFSAKEGQILACANVDDDEAEEVRILASGISREKADEAFRRFPPGSLEDAARLAAGLEERE